MSGPRFLDKSATGTN